MLRPTLFAVLVCLATPVLADEPAAEAVIPSTLPDASLAGVLPRADGTEAVAPGDVVGVYAGKISRKTTGADRVMVVTARPVGEGEPAGVALLGKASVNVTGRVRAGDYIVASGKEDGTGLSLAAKDVTMEQLNLVVGQAWESADSPTSNTVTVAVGFPAADLAVAPLRSEIARQQAEIDALKNELRTLSDLRQRLSRLEQTASYQNTAPQPVIAVPGTTGGANDGVFKTPPPPVHNPYVHH
jgi:hypothetical protein